jgi:hypothetical protein
MILKFLCNCKLLLVNFKYFQLHPVRGGAVTNCTYNFFSLQSYCTLVVLWQITYITPCIPPSSLSDWLYFPCAGWFSGQSENVSASELSAYTYAELIQSIIVTFIRETFLLFDLQLDLKIDLRLDDC